MSSSNNFGLTIDCLFATVTASALLTVAFQADFPVWAMEKLVIAIRAIESSLFFIIEIGELILIATKYKINFGLLSKNSLV